MTYARFPADQESDELYELFRALDVDIEDPLAPATSPTRSRSIVR